MSMISALLKVKYASISLLSMLCLRFVGTSILFRLSNSCNCGLGALNRQAVFKKFHVGLDYSLDKVLLKFKDWLF